MNLTWRTRRLVTVFRWLWQQLRHEGTRQCVLNMSLGALRDWLVQSSEEGVRVWLAVFEEARQRRWLEVCQTLLNALTRLQSFDHVAALSRYFRARLHHWRGRVRQAESSYHAVLAYPHANAYLQANALEGLGQLYYDQGWLSLSERLFHHSARKYRALNGSFGIASSYADLAVLYRRRNLWRQSLAYSHKALRWLGAPHNAFEAHLQGEILLGMSIVHRTLGRWSAAHRYVSQALALFILYSDRYGAAIATAQMGRTFFYQGCHRRATVLLHEGCVSCSRCPPSRRSDSFSVIWAKPTSRPDG